VYTVREARPGEAPLLAAVAAASFREAFGNDTPAADMDLYLAKAFDEAGMKADIDDPAIHVFLLIDGGGGAAGYAKMTGAASPVDAGPGPALSLERIYLRSAHLGKGGGDLLMRHCLDFARERGCRTVWLGVWQENHRAIAFYKRWGFEVYGTKKFVLGNQVNDDYLMKTDL